MKKTLIKISVLASIVFTAPLSLMSQDENDITKDLTKCLTSLDSYNRAVIGINGERDLRKMLPFSRTKVAECKNIVANCVNNVEVYNQLKVMADKNVNALKLIDLMNSLSENECSIEIKSYEGIVEKISSNIDR